jgi:hypothetical protein
VAAYLQRPATLSSTVAFNQDRRARQRIRALTASLTNSTVNANRAGTEGGGIFAGSATLINSTVGGNRALNGGGIRASTVTLTNSTVSANRAIGTVLPGPIYTGYGAGIDANAVTLTNSTVRYNHADESGGGIVAWEGAGGTVKMTNSTVYGNSAGDSGGGIWTNNITATNSTISGNSAHATGGGIHTNAGNLLNVTITRNSAFVGGGVYAFGFDKTLSIKNSSSRKTGFDTFQRLISVPTMGWAFHHVPRAAMSAGRHHPAATSSDSRAAAPAGLSATRQEFWTRSIPDSDRSPTTADPLSPTPFCRAARQSTPAITSSHQPRTSAASSASMSISGPSRCFS